MAGRVGEADDEWSRLRKEARRGREGLSVDGVVMGGKGSNWTRVDIPLPPKPATTGVADEDGNVDVKVAEGQKTEKNKIVRGKKRKIADLEGGDGAIGVYEPHSNLILCKWMLLSMTIEKHWLTWQSPDRADTQPTRAIWEPISNPKRRILGGTKAGNGAWGLAWVDTVMQLPEEDEEAKRMRREEQRERESFIKDAERMFGQGRDASVVPSASAATGILPRDASSGV